MSHLSPGLISAYNSLTDKHLAGYFSNTRIRRHLQRAGLITRSGRIVPDKEYRHKLNQRAHQRHVRECLAQAIFYKVLEMERLHQIEIKRKLEEFASRERVHKIKVDRSRRYEDDIIPVLSPHPPTGVRGFRKQHSGPEGEHSESSESLGSSRPNTAPGKMQRPVRLKPIHSNGTTASLRRSSPYRLQESSNENDPLFNCTMTKESRRRLTTMETSNDISPYRLPVINNFVVTPVPPATKRKERGLKVTPSGGTLRGRRLRPTTATSGANVTEDPPMLRSSVHHSRVCVNMVYFGKTVHLSHDLTDMRDDVKVFQQHCGGENLSVYKGKLREGESFQFISRRHRGFPFSLTFFLNGLQVERLSSCCEFKHRKGSRLGGRHGHFGFVIVEGASPCFKCIIAMGLDKKPTPPPKRVKEEGGREESVISQKDAPEMETEMTGEDAASQSDCEKSPPQEVECRVKEAHVTVQSRVRDDYEEDFEADDEGPVEEAKEKKSPSPSSDTETQVKEMDASETEDDEKDDDMKSRSGSSCTNSDQEASDDEATQDHREKVEQTAAVDEEETVAPPDEKDETYPEEAAATEAESGAAKEPDLQNSAGDSTEINISDTSVPLGQELKQSDDTSGEKKEEKTEDEGKQEEQGPERAKSVQEKLVEAILKESQCSSEPELSDTSTEEDEEATDKGHGQKSNDVVPEQLETLAEELKSEESVVEAEVVEDQEETSEPKEQEEDGTEKELHENRDSTKDELDKELDEDDEKPASEEEEEKLEDRGAALHAVSEGNMTPENKASEPEEDTVAKCNDSEAAQKDVESEEKTAEAEEADESSISELDRKTDETAASDNAEEEAMTVSETVEMKVEPSEEREALSCEEAPVSDTEERQQGDSMAASQAEVTTEDSSSSVEGSADTTVEKTADISEDSVKDEGSKDDVKKEEAELVSEDGNRQEEGLGGEQRERSVETNDEVEKEKSEEESKEAEGENCGEKEENEKEEEGKDESKTEEIIEDEANVVEDTRTDSNPERQTNEEPADEEDEVAHEEKAEESEKDEGSESVENKNDEEESEAKEAVIDKTSDGEEVKETKAERDEEKGEEAEKEERNEEEQMESEKSKDDNEEAEEGEEKSAITVEPEKNTDDEKTSSKNTAESAVNETADGNKTTEHTVESEDAKKETEGASSNSERGEIDGENGEISTGGERNSHNDDEIEVSKEERNDEKAAEHVEDERITEEEPTEGESAEVKEAESGDGAGKPDEDEVEQDHGTDASESEARERDDSDKQEETAQKDPEQESEETEITEESKPDHMDTDREQMKQDENGNKPELNERDSDLIENIDSKINEDEAQSSAPTDEGLGGTSHKLDESTATSDKKTCSDQHAAVANGENGEDAEEASKASEEGASVLLKPQAPNEEAPNAEESVAVDKESPEALAAEDSTDLVTNWVNTHQMSKDFETFVEPLEDLREETSEAQVYSKEETKSTELLRVETPPEVMKKSEKEENEQIHKVESEEKLEAVESEIESKPCEDEPQSDAIKDTTQEKEETEVEELNQMMQTEENDEESSNGQRKRSKESLEEDKDQKGPTQTQSDVSKTEVESIAGTHRSAASLKAESVTEEQSEEKTSARDPEKATETEETKYLQPASKTDEDNERPASPGGAKDAEESLGKTEEQSREVTEITDFTTSKSDDGSQEESHDGGIRPKPSGGSLDGERRDEQLIKDIKRTLSKDRLSSFSVDDTLFGSSSYPLLSAARTES
ncbi:glutamate-rich protein 3 isoform X1 [Hippoglossus hippoglossus]|uniref:glutamate-rich protein 3 isoform X1 n=1 Tax=Hippoglossus hippoglossus TaxID=8267 RepID=UPI00148B513A|nr:glutamate-rich protein 3 isoform X1 [Hippoglossus hippoglossus]